MKKILLVASVAIFGAALQAQETKFGVKAGYSLSTLKMDAETANEESYTTDPSHTFYIGGMVQHKFNDNFGIQGELLYSPLGGKDDYVYDEEGMSFGMKSKIELGTILIPVSAKYFISDAFAVNAGASFGLIVSAKAKSVFDGGMNIPGIELEIDDTVDIKDEVNTLNIAPFIGAEYTLENGLFFDARYNMGVSDLSKPDGKMTNSFAQIGVGFKFGGGY